jgi:hypothetical protein
MYVVTRDELYGADRRVPSPTSSRQIIESADLPIAMSPTRCASGERPVRRAGRAASARASSTRSRWSASSVPPEWTRPSVADGARRVIWRLSCPTGSSSWRPAIWASLRVKTTRGLGTGRRALAGGQLGLQLPRPGPTDGHPLAARTGAKAEIRAPQLRARAGPHRGGWKSTSKQTEACVCRLSCSHTWG